MGTIKIGSSANRKGITVNPSKVLFNGSNVKKIMSGTNKIWSNAKALIPIMTSNTAPSGVVSAKDTRSGGYAAYKAFNQTNSSYTDCWMSNSAPPSWLQYQHTKAVQVERFELTNRNHAEPYSPKNFELQGSNDGIKWVNLGSYTNDNNVAGDTYSFDVMNNENYIYHRIYVTTSNNGGNYVAIAGLQLYGG